MVREHRIRHRDYLPKCHSNAMQYLVKQPSDPSVHELLLPITLLCHANQQHLAIREYINTHYTDHPFPAPANPDRSDSSSHFTSASSSSASHSSVSSTSDSPSDASENDDTDMDDNSSNNDSTDAAHEIRTKLREDSLQIQPPAPDT